MKLIRYARLTIAVTGVLVLGATSALAQPFNYTFNVPDGDYNDGDNWLDQDGFAGFVPSANFDEIAVVGGGRLAHLSEAASASPAGVTINGGGTLELRSGADLTVEVGDPAITFGRVAVNSGSLVGLPGSSLTAEEVNSGGGGTIDLSGSASVTANVSSSLGGTTVITGPDVSYSAASLSNNGTIVANITGATHSVIDVSGDASLSGTLSIDFGVAPSFGDTWDIVNAQSISGNFANVTSNVSPGPGLIVASQIVSGGNGQIAQAILDSRLSLLINRRSGQVQIQDLAGLQSTTIDGYFVGSAGGTFDPAQWTQIGGNGWVPADATATRVGEVTLTEQMEIAASANIDLGNLYANPARDSDFGVAVEDVTFEYSLKSGEILTGLIDYTDAHNNIVLVVDTDTGETWMQNQSTFDVDIDGYEIESVSSSLVASNWQSFGGDWTEGNPADNHIGELNLTGSRLLGGESDAISLGNIFSPGGERDLFFTFNTTGIDGGDPATLVGIVEYEEGPIDFGGGQQPIAGDYDSDDFVGQGDIDLVLLNWGADVSGGPPPGWTSNLPTGSVDQDELDQVLLNWGNSAALGVGGATGVPEPMSGALALICLAFFAMLWRKRR